MPLIDEVPGFRRRFVITPDQGVVTAALEDDVHCMAVTLHHDGARIQRVEGHMKRWPWSTCPGAAAALEAAFAGVPLASATERGGKRNNCTHLYDLAELAAAHALDAAATLYELLVTDPLEGLIDAELRCNGEPVLRWKLRGIEVLEPAAIAGRSILHLRDWIASLDRSAREAARIAQWGCLVAHGRQLDWSQSAKQMAPPGSCHTFQPENASQAKHIGRRHDFSAGGRMPLSQWDGKGFRP